MIHPPTIIREHFAKYFTIMISGVFLKNKLIGVCTILSDITGQANRRSLCYTKIVSITLMYLLYAIYCGVRMKYRIA